MSCRFPPDAPRNRVRFRRRQAISSRRGQFRKMTHKNKQKLASWPIIARRSLSLLLLVVVSSALSHTIDIPSGAVECFFEDLHVDDQMTLTFQVAGGGHLDIDVLLSDPDNAVLWKADRRDTGTFTFTATRNGKHEYCFSNGMSTVSSKTVSFNVHGVMYVEEDDHTAPIEKEIKHLAEALEAVKEEQEYIVVREKLHRNTAESTNDRVKWWSLVQTALVFAVTAWQVFYLKRFFEVKRTV
ncbi:hypothetical protein O181_008676 [Austropuccinia psidii MF-1]|uniref:GOLD domain-containing protein n=1 Tax=Austropuccinia psidii MF-1 TaxID=1389203 RepID=A0A9Q3BMY1_9BASI|nr:hypothetical protein [Austropuccinia psidii MF-1]